LKDADEDIIDLKFQGFTNLDPDGKELPGKQRDPNTNINGLGVSNVAITESTSSPLGIFLIGVAGVVLVVLLTMLYVRRQKRREAYLRHLGEVNDLDLEPEEKYEMEQRGVLVNDSDVFSYDDGAAFEAIELENASHDYRTCASPHCALCSKRLQPVFVATDVNGLLTAEIIADLAGPERYQTRKDALPTDNTQVL
jgi:hypothetical protein